MKFSRNVCIKKFNETFEVTVPTISISNMMGSCRLILASFAVLHGIAYFPHEFQRFYFLQ